MLWRQTCCCRGNPANLVTLTKRSASGVTPEIQGQEGPARAPWSHNFGRGATRQRAPPHRRLDSAVRCQLQCLARPFTGYAFPSPLSAENTLEDQTKFLLSYRYTITVEFLFPAAVQYRLAAGDFRTKVLRPGWLVRSDDVVGVVLLV